jgi:hypothetical protein
MKMNIRKKIIGWINDQIEKEGERDLKRMKQIFNSLGESDQDKAIKYLLELAEKQAKNNRKDK